MDVPRLSTIQALLLLLKARESLPKKGYYYRSWQTVKTIVSMAKDLDIHEHYSNHSEGRPCDLSPIECLVSTRVWQALLVVEVMIGAPQGECVRPVMLEHCVYNEHSLFLFAPSSLPSNLLSRCLSPFTRSNDPFSPPLTIASFFRALGLRRRPRDG